jgi:hypothetical protein
MSDAAPTPRPLPAWFARFELVLLRVLAAASLASIAIAAQMLFMGVRELQPANPTIRTSAPATETTPTTSPSQEPIGDGSR